MFLQRAQTHVCALKVVEMAGMAGDGRERERERMRERVGEGGGEREHWCILVSGCGWRPD